MGILRFGDFLNERVKEIETVAGVVLLYNNKILLVHPTGASWQKGTCGIPKGHVEAGEEPLAAALRELREETGIFLTADQLIPSPETVEMYTPDMRLTKQLIYFVCNVSTLQEIGLESETVPKSQLQSKEIDWAKFVSAKEAYPITARKQLIILDRHLTL